MEKQWKSYLLLLVFLIFIAYAFDNVFISTAGVTSINVSSGLWIRGCGDSICEPGENCTIDNVSCSPQQCYLPTCENGCNYTVASNGSTDDLCYGNVGCSGGYCECNGLGNCTSVPPPEEEPTPPGGGGYRPPTTVPSGPQAEPVIDFELNKDFISVVLKQGESHRETFIIQNTGEEDIELTINDNLNNLVMLTQSFVILKPGERIEVHADFYASEEKEADVYTGQIIVSSEDVTKRINVLVEVVQKEPLFDVILNIDSETRFIYPTDDIKTEIKIKNMGDIKKVDVLLELVIKDFYGNLIDIHTETIAVEDETTVVRNMTTFDWMKPGNYVIYARVIYGDAIATSSDIFKILAPGEIIPAMCFTLPLATPYAYMCLEVETIVIMIITIITIFVLLLFFFTRKKKKKKRRKKHKR
ncbi:hypothetical protein ACFLQN_02850 [Candidatus Aenigmatarchaeota archaeon]